MIKAFARATVMLFVANLAHGDEIVVSQEVRAKVITRFPVTVNSAGWSIDGDGVQEIEIIERVGKPTSTYVESDGPDDPDPPGDLSETAKRYRDIAASIDDAANAINLATIFQEAGKSALSGELSSQPITRVASAIGIAFDYGLPDGVKQKWKPLRKAIEDDLVELQRTGKTTKDAGRLLVEASKGLSAAVGDPGKAEAQAIVAAAVESGEARDWAWVFRLIRCLLGADFESDDWFLTVIQCIVGG